MGRSKSCPNFDSWPVARKEDDASSDDWSDEEWETKPPVRRRRAYSEHIAGTIRMQRGVSDSHLDLIDKDATFDNQSIQTIQSKQIFAKAVDAAICATSNQVSITEESILSFIFFRKIKLKAFRLAQAL